MLTDSEIKSERLIGESAVSSFRSSSYDLRIAHVICPNGKLATSYVLPPQGIVQVVSKELVRLPDNITGVATVKTSLCQEGVLALSIGLIDPGYDGPISSFLVNFGKVPYLLESGSVFLRTTYYKLARQPETTRPFKVDRSTHLSARKRISIERFDKTFLNVDAIAAESAEQIVKKYRNTTLGLAGAFALGLALVTFFLNFGTLWLRPFPASADSTTVHALRQQNSALVKRVEALEKAKRPEPGGVGQ